MFFYPSLPYLHPQSLFLHSQTKSMSGTLLEIVIQPSVWLSVSLISPLTTM